ncbi:helix-turn-helix domain-containing protein [Streptomyces sp. BSE6.1]|uniref:helix-turn-helix domain-containing protein n=1 Tax=Streptomyces sp. BSE6.1 TaxID=2605730 RepID=UPI001F214699|nr:helix-turn-helix transcriptional regulator [Streptomyces sp. BSE6.1]
MTTNQDPTPPAEAVLIKEALRRARLSGRTAARRAGISDARWRQIINGYQSIGGQRIAVKRAPDETIARMAHAAGVTPDELRQTGRTEAADLLAELAGPPTPASTADQYAADPHIDAIAALLATLPPEAQDEVLRRVGRGEPVAPVEEQEEQHRRAV